MPITPRTRFIRASIALTVTATLNGAAACSAADIPPIHGLNEVPLSQVDLRGGFWGPRLDTQIKVTIPHELDYLERTGHITNFDKAAGVYDGPLRGHVKL